MVAIEHLREQECVAASHGPHVDLRVVRGSAWEAVCRVKRCPQTASVLEQPQGAALASVRSDSWEDESFAPEKSGCRSPSLVGWGRGGIQRTTQTLWEVNNWHSNIQRPRFTITSLPLNESSNVTPINLMIKRSPFGLFPLSLLQLWLWRR